MNILFLTSFSIASFATESVKLEVKEGDTFSNILNAAGVPASDISEIVKSMEGLYDPVSLRVGNTIKVQFDNKKKRAGSLRNMKKLDIFPTKMEKIEVKKNQDDSFEAQWIKVPVTTRVVKASGRIQATLYGATRAAGVPFNIRSDFIKKYSYDVDFQRDLRKGDKFDILYEQLVNSEGDVVGSGNIVYASLRLRKGDIAMYLYQTMDGEYDYYSPDGTTIKKSFLRTPVDGARITSKYGVREHPILGFTKMHKGLDFGAPKGTPVYAAGPGVVVEAERKGTYGNYLRIMHRSGYSTAYAHLNGFRKGLKRGTAVGQGEIIGYVGTTGRSTGPHLHYEVIVDGKQINPLSVKTVALNQLKGLEYGIFNEYMRIVNREVADVDAENKVAVLY